MGWSTWPLEERVAVVCGLIGQLIFTLRFVVQWLASERAGKSVTPRSFWYLSIGGSVILLGYAIYRRDVVIILGQAFGSFVYFRNLVLIDRERTRSAAPELRPERGTGHGAAAEPATAS